MFITGKLICQDPNTKFQVAGASALSIANIYIQHLYIYSILLCIQHFCVIDCNLLGKIYVTEKNVYDVMLMVGFVQ